MQKMLFVSLITLALITPIQSMSMQRGSASAEAAQCLGSQCKKTAKMICPKCKEILFCSSKCKKQSMKAHAQVCGQNAGAAAAAKESADTVEVDTDGTMSIADALELSQEQFNGLPLETHVALTQGITTASLADQKKLLGMLANLPHEREAAIREKIAQEMGFGSLQSAMSAILRSFDATRASASPTE